MEGDHHRSHEDEKQRPLALELVLGETESAEGSEEQGQQSEGGGHEDAVDEIAG